MSSVVVDVDGNGIAVVRLNRPKRFNALNYKTMVLLAEELSKLSEDTSVRCVILTGDGSNFCAGVDLSDAMSVFNGKVFQEYMSAGFSESDPMYWLERMPVPVIAAVDGVAITAGFEIVLACDIVVATERASFQDTHAKFGIQPFWGLSVKLARLVGANRAREFSLGAKAITAEVGKMWGLVNHVVPSDVELLPAAMELAIAISNHPPQAVKTYKKTILDGLSMDAATARKNEFDVAMKFYSSEAFAEAAMAMIAATKQSKL